MLGHDRFEELSALAAIGQINASEHSELSEHLAECDDCREAYLAYSQILRQDLPRANPVRSRMKDVFVHPASESDVRDRFFARARAEGARLSGSAERVVSHPSKPWLLSRLLRSDLSGVKHHRVAFLLAGATSALAIGMIVISLARLPREVAKPVATNAAPQIEMLIAQNKRLRNEVDALQAQLDSTQTHAATDPQPQPDLERIHWLEHQLTAANQELVQLRVSVATSEQQNSVLAQTNARDSVTITQQKSENDKLRDANNETVAALVDAQDRVRALNAGLDQAKEKFAMEQQLTAASSDVRQLMGARSLHIIDVHDVNGAGKSAKSFGRVFYSEGQSLIFYAFDLPNGKLTPAKYYFRAWGQMEGQIASVRNLGTFSVDDREQHRWVLKVNDARLLTGIDSLFVTAESTADATQPHGKRVLYAYLAGSPNHP